MLATLMVAVVTVGLLLTGALIVSNSQQPSDAPPADAEYSEDFFGSLNSLVGGLNQKEAGTSVEQERSDRYQLYLDAKERASAKPTDNLFLNVGKQPTQGTTSQAPAAVATPPQGTTTQTPPVSTEQNQPAANDTIGGSFPTLDEDLLDFSDFDIDLDDFSL